VRKKQLMSLAGIIVGAYSMYVAASQKPAIDDIRKFGLKVPHNKQDLDGNTFWHQLAFASNRFQDWSQVVEKERIFRADNNNWLPNPLIENNNGNTAKKEAKKIFKQSGNPISGLLVVHLRKSEEIYLNRMALKTNRERMKYAQYLEHPHDPNK